MVGIYFSSDSFEAAPGEGPAGRDVAEWLREKLDFDSTQVWKRGLSHRWAVAGKYDGHSILVSVLRWTPRTDHPRWRLEVHDGEFSLESVFFSDPPRGAVQQLVRVLEEAPEVSDLESHHRFPD